MLKDSGKLCYIIPQTILTAGDLDVLRYHLAQFTTVEKIITFSGKMFIGRGLKQNKPVATSSLILVISKKRPSIETNQVEIINYKDPNDEVEKCLQNISAGKKIVRKKIKQQELLVNIANWNFIKHDKLFIDLFSEYKKKTDDISIYYDHIKAESEFGGKFYFDIGYGIDEKSVQNIQISNGYLYPKLDDEFWLIQSFRGYWPNERIKKNNHKINLLTTNQGYNLLDSKYKILWSYANPNKFHFSALPLIWARNQICAVGSNNKQEMLYLFSILNSLINRKILNATLRSENEKDFLMSLASIKQFVRVPKITKDNQFIKDEIIKKIEGMLALEDIVIADLVDFSGVLIQKFDEMKVIDNNLVFEKDNKQIKCKIIKDKNLAEKTIEGILGNKKLLKDKQIILSELKSLPAIDFEKQREIKDYVDDLVFALYFNVSVKKVGLIKAGKIKQECEKNKFYKLVKSGIAF